MLQRKKGFNVMENIPVNGGRMSIPHSLLIPDLSPINHARRHVKTR